MALQIKDMVKRAREAGNVPRLHPNGFIQLDLQSRSRHQRRRLHIWPAPEQVTLPKPAVEMQIHDHTFSFSSLILAGALTNITKRMQPYQYGTHKIYNVMPFVATGQQSPFTQTDRRWYDFPTTSTVTYRPGEEYDFPAFAFHETQAEGYTATVICIGAFDHARSARVACPVNLEPDTSFRRDSIPEDVLWGLIEQLPRLARSA